MLGKKILAVLMSLTMCISAITANVNIGVKAVESSTRVQEIMANMSVRQKITQMLMPDFRKWSSDGSAAADFTVMNDQVSKIIEDYDFGGLILFANNVKGTEQSLNLTKAMQEAATKDGGTPLLLGIDQEGGIVYRLGSGSAMPGNMAVGATYTEHGTKYAKMAGQIIGRELAALGINTNFAPTVDVNNNANNPVIGLRSFGDDPQMVAELSVAMIEGMNEYNIITSAKHFPGHGDTATDSHTGLPVVDKSLEALMQCELVPFQAAMDAGTDMFMVAHIAYPQVDPTTANGYVIPATVSKTILTDLVRDTMNYDGVLITDAMNMAGLANLFTQQEAAVKAIQAGNDILLMPCQLYNNTTDLANLDSIIAAIETAVANGEISEARLNESVKRILDLKEKRGILDYDASKYTLENAEAQVGSQQNRDEEREIAAAAVTVVRNEENVLPLQPKAGEKVLFLGAYANELPGMDLGFRRVQDAGLAKGVTYETYRYSSSTSEATLRSKIEAADYVVCISEVGSSANAKPTHWVTAKPALVTSIANELGKKVVILSISKPYDVQAHPTADAMVAVYGNKGMDPTEALTPDAAFGPNITAGVEVIFGGFEATGTLPVNIPRFTEAYTYDHDDIVYNRGFGLKYSSLPAAATNVKAESVDYKTIKLTWDAVEAATSYIVERKVSDTDKWMLVGTTTEPTYTVDNVKTGKEYTYRVQSVNGKVKGAYSVDFVGKAELTGEVTLTIAPNGSDKFDLSWTQVDGATRYIIYRKSGEGEWQKLLTLGKDATTYTTKAMLPGTYSYMVKAGRYDSVDRVMTEGSNVVEGVATKDTPTITIEKGEGDNVTISWSKVEGMKGYDVYRATTIDGKYTQLKRTTSTSITTTIKAGKTYFYKVRGFDVVNDVKVYSTYSETVSYTAN